MSTSVNDAGVGRPVPSVVDWLVGPLLVVVGLVGAAAGYIVAGFADMEWSAQLVSEMEVTSTIVTESTLAETVYNLTLWGGRGLIATGLVLAIGGIAFLLHRRRVRDRDATGPDTITIAVLGAVVTTVAMMVPLSPLLGGAVAGYFGGATRREGTRQGAYAGVVTAIPAAVLFAFLAWGTVAASASVIGVIMLAALVFSALYTVGLSAVGGYLGVALAED